jgi:hypothetical protein
MKKTHAKKSTDEIYKISKKKLGYAILALAVIVILITLYYQGVFESFLPEQKEEVQPEKQVLDEFKLIPEVELTAVTVDCKECINASQAADIIKDAPIFKVLKTEFIESDSAEGKALIEKYDLKRLPAFIMTGEEISNIDLPTFEKREGAQVFDATPPPYYDVASEKIKGLVEVIKLTDDDCEKCFDLDKLTVNLKQFGIKFASEKTIDISSEEGKKLISDYSITKVPTIIFSSDANEYAQIQEIWETVGSTESDGKMILRTVNPPYKDLETDDVKGVVDVTHLVDASCTECFDTAELKKMFEQQMGMAWGVDKTVDVSSVEGKQFIEDFDIKLVPTIIFSSDLADYPTIPDMWSQIGIEKDGKYVLTKLDLVQGLVYKNLETDEIVGLKEETTEESTTESVEEAETDTSEGNSTEE